jgi:hypothetical protein
MAMAIVRYGRRRLLRSCSIDGWMSRHPSRLSGYHHRIRATVAAPGDRLLPGAQWLYPTAIARLLHGLALAGQARAADGAERGELLLGLDDVTRWLTARAADAPDNFRHLLRSVEAERAWAVGDFRAAVLASDAALREVDGRNRPRHRALIAEHAAHFHLAHGAEHAGRGLLAQTRDAYAAWGATAKVAQLDWAYPRLRLEAGTTARPGERPPMPQVSGRRSRPARSTCSAFSPRRRR